MFENVDLKPFDRKFYLMTMVPYKLLLAAVQIDGDNVLVSRNFLNFLLQKVIQNAEFDELRYLKLNPDVAASVRQGEWETGQDHYIARGYFEGREGADKPMSESWYLRTNPDVAAAVTSGEWPSGESHYHERGMFEWRAPNRDLQDTFVSWKSALTNSSSEEASPVSTVSKDPPAGA
jgi:hypothetical protein